MTEIRRHKKNLKERGITLIALVVTIIVLLILAGVALSALTGDSGILNNAESAKGKTNLANAKEQIELSVQGAKLENVSETGEMTITYDNLKKELDSIVGNGKYGIDPEEEADSWTVTVGEYQAIVYTNGKIEENNEVNSGDASRPATTIEEAQSDTMLVKTVNSDITDKYTNKITIPAGFKILVDETTEYISSDINVTKGIVITDGTNEFVWVPVGEKIYKSENKNEYETINLDRYTFLEDGTPVPQGDKIIDSYQELSISTFENITALSIDNFIRNSTAKGGYYLARYEAGIENGVLDISDMVDFSTAPNKNWTAYDAEEGKDLQLVSKKNVQVWNYITQSKASDLSRNMYDKKTFTSDLVNSYAWDTAIVFIQKFSECSDYYNQNFSTNFGKTGTNNDKYCNLYDMSGNAWEYSTETCNDINNPCVTRGGCYNDTYGIAEPRTFARTLTSYLGAVSYASFRPLLYIEL